MPVVSLRPVRRTEPFVFFVFFVVLVFPFPGLSQAAAAGLGLRAARAG